MPSPLGREIWYNMRRKGSIMYAKLAGIYAIVAATVWSAPCSGVTIHRSFRTREVGIGGGAGVVVPVERKVAEALDRQAREDAEKRLKIVGRVTKVENFNTVYVTPNGGQRRFAACRPCLTASPSSGRKLHGKSMHPLARNGRRPFRQDESDREWR